MQLHKAQHQMHLKTFRSKINSLTGPSVRFRAVVSGATFYAAGPSYSMCNRCFLQIRRTCDLTYELGPITTGKCAEESKEMYQKIGFYVQSCSVFHLLNLLFSNLFIAVAIIRVSRFFSTY